MQKQAYPLWRLLTVKLHLHVANRRARDVLRSNESLLTDQKNQGYLQYQIKQFESATIDQYR